MKKLLSPNKIIVIGLVFICLLTFLGCDALLPKDTQPSPSVELLDGSEGQETPNNEDNHDNVSAAPEPSTDSVRDYFPIYVDTRLVYEGERNEYAYYNIYTDYATENTLQQRIDNGGTQSIKVIEVSDSAIVQKLFRGEAYYRENLLRYASPDNANDNADGGHTEILLKAPIEVGNEWTLSDGFSRSITDVDVDVETPHGVRKAVEVTTVGEYGTTIDYYSEGIGLVKTIYRTEGTEISSTLRKIEESVPFVQLVNFYFPNIEDSDHILYISKEVPFYTNDVTRSVLEAEYKEAYSEDEEKISSVFSENTTINSLYLNKDGMVYIDLSEDYLTEMNAGAGYESAMLQCIANTFGGYYNVDRVYLTIDDELYSSGHISLKKGEYIEVKIEDAESIKM